MKILLTIVVMALTGCAHATINEICSNPETLAKYKNYDQCYAEETLNRQQREQKLAEWRKAWNQSWSNMGNRVQRQPTCTTTYNSYMNTYNTQCQ